MFKYLACATIAITPLAASASTFDILWWDATPEFGTQAPDALRKEMSDYLDAFDGGSVFNSSYVSSLTPGSLATHLGSNSYDVVIIDSTDGFGTGTFNSADQTAVQNMYAAGKDALGFDGNLYVRNINFVPESDFPGPGGAMGGFTVNSVFALAEAGGGLLFGTDHDCCQGSVNFLLQSILPGAAFSGSTTPSTDGVFYGDLLLNGPEPIAAADVLAHWNAIPSQAIAPTGTFTDFLGNQVTLSSLVDVADFIGGPKNSMFSTSLAPGSGTTDVDDDTVGGSGGDASVVPLPMPGAMLLTGLVAMGWVRRRA